MKKYKVTSTEIDGSDPFSTLHYTEEEARDLVALGNSSSLFRVYSYEEVNKELVDEKTYVTYYTRDGETWDRALDAYSTEEALRNDWKVLLDRGDAKVIERTTTEKYID